VEVFRLRPRIIQVEVSTKCQLKCGFCPRTLFKDRWRSEDISWDHFVRILPYAGKVELVHLQGWGEPLLHPGIWKMATAIKEKGGRISMTTNGMLMDDAAVRQICEIGFSFIAVSMAGARAGTHDSLRIGSSFGRICENVSRLSAAKSHPGIHLVMQMMKPNIDELPELVDLAAELGADSVIAPNLDYTPVARMEDLKVFARIRDTRLGDVVEEAVIRGKKHGIGVRTYPVEPDDNCPVCSDDPLNNVVINVRGEVAPCVYLSMPVEGDIPRMYWGEHSRVSPFTYGNVKNGLRQTLESAQAKKFRKEFERRVEYTRLDAIKSMSLLTLPGIRNVRGILQRSKGHGLISASTAIPPAPAQCRGCYKLQGI